MRYQMLALDMDDTLLGKDLKISPQTLEKIRLAKDLGVKVVIATGRMFRAIVPYLKQMGTEDEPAIVYNGAMIKYLNKAKPIIHHPIPLPYARKVANLVEEAGFQLNAYLNDLLYVREKTPEVISYMERTGVDSTEVGSINEFLKEEPTKLLVINYDLVEIEQLREKLLEYFGDILTITGSKPYFIEITAQGISKGSALAELARFNGLSREEVIAVGDGLNDLSMIKWAGLGVAVANAHPVLREAADYITGSCDEEGVAQVIDTFILQRG